ncbi:MAG: TRAP transporter large permease subunit [Pseudomonadota bacterium]
MIEILAHNLAPIMFVTVMGLLILGYPVAFTLAAGGLGFFVVGVWLSDLSPAIGLSWDLLKAHPERIFGIMGNETLLAIPFFTFMGLVLERSGMAEDLLKSVGQMFGAVRGGLAYAVVVVGALLAATTGVVAASVIAMGLISLPIMLRYGYKREVVAGSITAAGALAQIVPPSLVLIVLADQMGRSVGDMYLGALYPALLLIGAYCLYILLLGTFRGKSVPALPEEAREFEGGILSLILVVAASSVAYALLKAYGFTGLRDEVRIVWSATLAACLALGLCLADRRLGIGLISDLAQSVIVSLLPPLALIMLVLGTIFLGIATPTEGGAMGAIGALAIAILRRRLTLVVLNEALDYTVRLSAFVMFILIGARIFALTFYGVNGNVWVEDLMLSLPGGAAGFLIFVTLLVFILGCFLDFFEVAFIVIPLLVPVAVALDIDLIWFGVILAINLQTSFLTPPFGFALFYLRSVAPSKPWRDAVSNRMLDGLSTGQIYRGVLPFIVIQIVVIGLVIWQPGLVTHYADIAPAQEGSIDFGTGGGGFELPSFD